MLKKYFPPLLILGLVLALFLANYAPNTYLSGWDNLHPEFNFLLNIKRSLFAVWQEYQGLGLLGGMGHASDLPRQLVLFLFSFVFPASFLRYFYTFLMLFLGSLGLYLLLKNVVLEKLETKEKEVASLLGAIFYLLNLATIQTFYFTFEPFITHFGFLPLLFYVFLAYLLKPTKKNLLLFFLTNLFALPQAYVPTIFLVYLAVLFIFLLSFLWQTKNRLYLKRSLILLFFTFCVNALWFLPFAYFALTSTSATVEAKTNLMYTEEVFLKNQKYGTVKDVVLLKGFWFDNTEPIRGQTAYIMSPWRSHMDRFAFLGYFLFCFVLLGIVYNFCQKDKIGLSFLGIFIILFALVANADPLFFWLNKLLWQDMSLFAQVFRFPFMKFSIALSFVYAIYFAYGCLFLFQLLKDLKQSWVKKVLLALVSVFPVLVLIIFVLPVWQGDLFYSKLKAKIPQEYFDLFGFFASQDKSGRIANFPQPVFNGWTLYRFNYSGSGFLWYGIEQPILDRAFDVWSREDENYYWEISYALYSQNQQQFENVLQKYQVSWLLVDKNVIYPYSPKALYFDELEQMLSESKQISLEKTFGSIKVYRVNLKTPVKSFVSLVHNLPVVGPQYRWGNDDRAYSEFGHYITNSQFPIPNSQAYYPFRSLFSGRRQEDLEFSVEEQKNALVFKAVLPEAVKNYLLVTPPLNIDDLVWVDPAHLDDARTVLPEVTRKGNLLQVQIPKIGGYFSAVIDPASDLSPREVKAGGACNQLDGGEAKNEIVLQNGRNLLRLSSRDATNCSPAFWLATLDHSRSYLVTMESRRIAGQSLLFWLENLNLRRADIETYLSESSELTTSYFVQPPMDKYGLGYSLHLDNISIGRQVSVNDLGKITVQQIPYHFLTQMELVPQNFSESQPSYESDFTVSHPNPSFYQVQLPTSSLQSPSTLVLSQSFSPGWKGYIMTQSQISKLKSQNLIGLLTPFVGERLKDHVLVNNWENGWVINPENQKEESIIVLIYLPQLLEYLGFLFLLVIPLSLLRFHLCQGGTLEALGGERK